MGLFSSLVRKDAGVNAVHVTTALGNQRKSRFRAALEGGAIEKRHLHRHDDATAKTPFLYDANALANIRPDQAPRFFGALTDSDKLEEKTVKLSDLVAMQDRVDPQKVEAIAAAGIATTKLPVVVAMGGKQYIADGHHRLAGRWLAGDEEATVRFKDLEPVSNALKRATGEDGKANVRIAKVDEELGLVFGWAIVCKINGEDYYDLNIDQDGPFAGQRVPEHVPESAMVKAAVDFAQVGAPGNEMHSGPDVGTYVFQFPMTTEIAKAMGITTEKTGLMVAYKPPADVLAKFKDGTYTGFSIEGARIACREHE